MKFIAVAVVVALVASLAMAQDPAPGWLSYATASCPSNTRMTRFEATWKVLGSAQPSDAFYSPWIGSDTTDNLNLIQPVNPWFGSSWSIYTEYFQWSPENNVDSDQHSVNSGDTLHAVIEYTGNQQYRLSQTDTTLGKSSSMNIPVQQNSDGTYKNYSIFYIVFEKVADCANYPPNQKITFSNIITECDGRKITPNWTTSYVEDVCSFRAHVINPSTVTMTWNVNDKNPTPEQRVRSLNSRHRMRPQRKH